jgi:O-antigen/teichoic acid export membrane protein
MTKAAVSSRSILRFVRRKPSQSFVSLASFCVSFLVLAISLPFLVRLLGPRQYGAWVLSGGIANYVLVFDFGLSLSIARFVARDRLVARERAEEAITVALVALTGVGVMVIVVTSMLASAWQSYVDVAGAGFALRAGGIAATLTLVSKVLQAALEGAGVIAVTRVVVAAGSIFFAVGGIIVLLASSQGLVALSVFLVVQSIAVAVTLALLLARKWGRLPLRRPKRGTWRRVVGYSLTLQGSVIIVAALDPLSRFLVLAAAGPAAVAPVDIALRTRSQLFGAALAVTRPFLPRMGEVNDIDSGADQADNFWRPVLPVAVATGLFVSVSSYFLMPVIFGEQVGDSAATLTAVLSAAWIPAVAGIVPYLFILLHGTARQLFMIQLLNGVAALVLMGAVLPTAPEWAVIVGLSAGSLLAVVEMIRRSRKLAGRSDLFQLRCLVVPFERTWLLAPLVGSVPFFLPGPLMLRAAVAFAAWTVLVRKSALSLIRAAG